MSRLIGRASAQIELAGGQAPSTIELLPVGAVDARDGRHWRNDAPERVLADSRRYHGRTPAVIDYEHQTDYAEANGQPAPAAGWITALALAPDGQAITADVEWTERARAHIEGGEYKYISPVFDYDKQGNVTRILRASLTNKPALDMSALAKSEDLDTMNEHLKKILVALGFTDPTETDVETAIARVEAAGTDRVALAAAMGLDDGADQAALVAKAAALKAAGTDRVALAAAMGLDDGADQAALVAKAAALKAAAEGAPDPAKWAPAEQLKDMAAALKTLQDKTAEDAAQALVAEGMTAGKIAPTQKDWALAYAKSDADGFAGYLAAAPVIVAPGEIGNGGLPPGDIALTAAEKAVCAATGITEETFLATKKAELEAAA